jgi:hypothetical protein
MDIHNEILPYCSIITDVEIVVFPLEDEREIIDREGIYLRISTKKKVSERGAV